MPVTWGGQLALTSQPMRAVLLLPMGTASAAPGAALSSPVWCGSATAEARLNARLAAGKRLLSLVHLASKYEAEHETVGADTPDILLQDAGLAQKLSADAQAAGAFGSSMGSHVEAGTLPELAKFQIHYSKVRRSSLTAWPAPAALWPQTV